MITDQSNNIDFFFINLGGSKLPMPCSKVRQINELMNLMKCHENRPPKWTIEIPNQLVNYHSNQKSK